MSDTRIRKEQITSGSAADGYVLTSDGAGVADWENPIINPVNYDEPSELTIAAGQITVSATYHTVDTQGDDPSDDLVLINGGTEGDILSLRPANGSRTVVIKHNTGNIWLIGEEDISLEDLEDHIQFIYNGGTWRSIGDGGGGGGSESIIGPTWHADGTLAVLEDIGEQWIMPSAGTIVEVIVIVKDNGSASSTIVDVHKNGTTIFTTQGNRPEIANDDADNYDTGVPDVTAFDQYDVFTADIDQVGTDAKDLRIILVITGTTSSYTNDTYAIHDNVAGEIHAITEKGSPVDADEIVIEDSADSWAKKRVSLNNLAIANHDHSGDAGDGGTFDAANLTAGASTDGQVLTSDGAGGAAWENAPAGGAVDAADVTYTPTTAADWDSDADPGNADDAFDQLAERVQDIEDAGGGGAPTDAKYITSAADAGLSAEVIIPGLAASADIAGAGGAGTSEEFDSGVSPFSWSNALDAEDINTTIKSHWYANDNGNAERLGTKAWSPAGALSARAKISLGGAYGHNAHLGLHIGDADNSDRAMCSLAWDETNDRFQIRAFTYTSASYTQRGDAKLNVSSTMYVRIDRDGSNNWSFYYSYDGILWQHVITQALTFTVANIGFRVNSGAAAIAEFACDWLRTSV